MANFAPALPDGSLRTNFTQTRITPRDPGVYKYTPDDLVAQSNDAHGVGHSGLEQAADELSWQRYFGYPDEEKELQLPKPQEKRDLPEAYKGKSEFLSNLIIRRITAQQQFPVREILPWKKWEQSLTVGWTEFHFNDHMLTETPHEVPPRLLSSQEVSRSEPLKRYGIALMLEHGFMLTEEGRLQYEMNLQQIANAVLNTCIFGVMTALVTSVYTPSAQPQSVYNRLYSKREFLELLRLQKKFFAILQKEEFGALQVIEYAKAQMQQRSVSDTNTVIWPDGGAKFVNFSRPERRQKFYSSQAGDVDADRSLLSGVNGGGGFKEFESSPVPLGDGNGCVDPLFRLRTTGDFHVMNDEYLTNVHDEDYRTSLLTIKVYDEDRDAIVQISPHDVWAAAIPPLQTDNGRGPTIRGELLDKLAPSGDADVRSATLPLDEVLQTMNGDAWLRFWCMSIIRRIERGAAALDEPLQLKAFLDWDGKDPEPEPEPAGPGPAPAGPQGPLNDNKNVDPRNYVISITTNEETGANANYVVVIDNIPSATPTLELPGSVYFGEVRGQRQVFIHMVKMGDAKEQRHEVKANTLTDEVFAGALTTLQGECDGKTYNLAYRDTDGQRVERKRVNNMVDDLTAFFKNQLRAYYDSLMPRGAAAAGGGGNGAAAGGGGNGGGPNKRRRTNYSESHERVLRGLRKKTGHDLWALIQICLDENVRLPIGFLLLRPHVTHWMGSAVVCTRGPRLGHTLYGHLDFQLADNVAHKMHYGNFTMYAKAQIMDRMRLIVIPDVFARGYHGGGGTEFYHMSNRDHKVAYQTFDNSSNRDMFACIVPATWRAPEDLDIAGHFNNVERDLQPHYPTAQVYADYWGWTPTSHDVENLNFADVASMPRVHNTLVSQGFQVCLSGDGTTPHYRIDKGVFGERVYEGCGDVRKGLSGLLKPVNYTNTSTFLIEM